MLTRPGVTETSQQNGTGNDQRQEFTKPDGKKHSALPAHDGLNREPKRESNLLRRQPVRCDDEESSGSNSPEPRIATPTTSRNALHASSRERLPPRQ